MAFSLALLSAGRSGLRLGACALALGLAFNAHAAKKDDTLRMAYDQAPESVDPYYNNVRIGVIIAANVWDTLLYRDPMTNEYKGQLAKSWKQVDDKTLEFELRQGVKFHNGEEFDADSVVYTLNFVADPKNKAVTQQNVAWIDKVEKIDKYHVRLTTKEPFPGAKEYLSTTVAIHPAKYYQEVGPKGMNAKPVGSGPYKVADYQPGKSITLERNTDYFKDSPKAQPKIGKVVIRFIPDRQTQMAEVISGGEDLIMSVPKDQADQLRAVPTLQVVNGETMRIVFMQMNILENSPAPQLKDERVRRAIVHAIDRQAILKNIVGDGGAILNAICTPSQVGCTQDVPTYKYDPAQAKKLLAEAGYPNGFDIDILAYRERNQTEAIINYLQAVGIRAKLNFLPIRRHARHDTRGQGLHHPPDLGLQPGQRRLGLHAGVLRLRQRRHHARRQGQGAAGQGRSHHRGRAARGGLQGSLVHHRRQGLCGAAVDAAGLLRRQQGSGLQALSG